MLIAPAAAPRLLKKLPAALAGLPTLDQLQRERHRRSFYEFFKDFWSELEPAAPYIEAPHIEALCDHFQALFEGKFSELSIEIGPGFAKSLVSAVAFPAWVWGPARSPAYRMAFSTYAENLTVRDSDKCRKLISSERYQRLYGHVFRLTKATDDQMKNDKSGLRIAVSVKGETTGHRVNAWICDDLLNMVRAVSPAERKVVHTHLEAVSSRGIVGQPFRWAIIGQRLHEEDAGGWAREQGFVTLCLPTEYDPGRHCVTPIFEDWRRERGELLFPAGFGADKVELAKKRLRDHGWSAQHQQMPVPRDGGAIKDSDVQYFDRKDRPKAAFYFFSIDTAQGQSENNDKYGVTVWGVFRKGIFLADAWNGRERSGAFIQRVTRMCQQWKPSSVVIEQRDWGKALLQLLEDTPSFRWKLVPYQAVIGKDMRAEQASAFFYEDRVWMERGSPLAEMAMAQLKVFPQSKDRDLADSVIQAALHAQATYTFDSPLTVEMLDYQGGKRASRTAGSIYAIHDDDEDD